MKPDRGPRQEGGRSGCRECWPGSADLAWEARRNLLREAEIVGESHFSVMLLRCGACRQLYVSVFAELIDWEGGDDSQQWTLMPITEEETAALAGTDGSSAESFLASLGPERPSLVYSHPRGTGSACFWSTGIFIPPHD